MTASTKFLRRDGARSRRPPLAQVHRAVLKDGTEVAVKIQYPGLLEQMASDFAVIRMFGQQIKPGGFDLTWVVNDFEVSISAELDFTIEGMNAELTGKDFAHQPYAKVPKVFWEHTTKRVLTMEFVWEWSRRTTRGPGERG